MLRFSSYEELLENEALKKKAAKSGVSYGTLKKVFNRGMAAWKSGHRPGTTPQQWGHARVNSYITKGKGTYYGADSDLSGKGKKKDKKEGYVSYAQQQAAHASMADKKKKNNESVEEARVTSIAFRKKQAMVNPMDKKNIGDMAKDKKYKGNTSALMRDVKKKYPDQHHSKIVQDIYRKHAETNEATVKEISKGTLDRYIKKADADKSKKHVRADVGKISRDDAYKNQIKRNKGIQMAKAKMNPAKVAASEATVKEISKNLAKNYMGKAARDMYHKGQQQGNKDAISRLGGPDQDYMKSPERKAAMRVRGMDRATNRLMKKEAMSDAEKAAHQKAIDAFKAKGGKVKKLKPGYAQGYHGKADPAAGIKGMIDKGDTKFMSKKKVGSMK
tara:strand:+ start:1924 stop:3087 length:1164 start_codon:yes stop_codon:yes gene_type:complete